MDSGFLHRDVKPFPEMLIGAALLTSFGDDLSRWRITIANDGSVKQELFRDCAAPIYEDVCIQLASRLCEGELEELRARIYAADFLQLLHLSEVGRDFVVDGAAVTSLTCNVADGTKRIEMRSAWELAHDGNAAAIEYMELWDLIGSFAPYKGRTKTLASEAKVRSRVAAIYGPFPTPRQES